MPSSSVEAALAAVRAVGAPGSIAGSGVDVHFHPDAITADGATVLEALVADGRWRTQFETGTSNGGLTAFPGGDRWRWESRLFSGAYDAASAEERPVYGALSTARATHGGSPRFGSALIRLDPGVLTRTTLAHPDSAFEPRALGTVDRFGAIAESLRRARPEDPLDDYVEAHVHGGVLLARDAAALVLDPSFRGTAIEASARRAGLRVEWHPGFVLEPDAVAGLGAYRGPEVAAAAERVADGRPLTPLRLGLARAAGDVDARTAKRIWHLLAAFGRMEDPRARVAR